MPMSSVPALGAESPARSLAVRRVIAIVLGAVVVAISAQISIPIPGSPVPITLQGFAVLLVGGMLGAGPGAAALVLYLLAGTMGLPVFAPVGLPGVARLLGPTGGYLLAFPVAAAVTGALARSGGIGRSALAALLGMLVIHLGGIAQLAVITGSFALPLTATGPLLAADLVKVVLAALLIARFRSKFQPT
ncbi:MAG: biotin transporter BioY [Gemmatimonadota bacterium]